MTALTERVLDIWERGAGFGIHDRADLLLDLARAQKVDLARISILSLVEQFLAVIEGARRVRLELAADWLVMAAWLAWLKSRLLLPDGSDAAEEGELAADILAARLRDLSAIRAGAVWLSARPQLGHAVFVRGAPEDHTEIDRSRLAFRTCHRRRYAVHGQVVGAGTANRLRAFLRSSGRRIAIRPIADRGRRPP